MDARGVAARLGSLFWLALVWVMLWGSIAPGTILAGILVALIVTVLLPLPRVPVEGRVHLVSTAALVVTVLCFLVTSSLQVAWTCVRPAPPPRSTVVRVPLRLKSDFVLALAINALNLIPGGIVVRVEARSRHVHVHLLDGSPRSVDAFLRQLAVVERRFVRALERPADWKPSPLHNTAYLADDPEVDSPGSEVDGATAVAVDPDEASATGPSTAEPRDQEPR